MDRSGGVGRASGRSPDHVGASAVGGDGQGREDGGGEVNVAALLADLLDRVEIIESNGGEAEV